jgi:predicted protein tyrosine phosphatase
MKTIETTRRVFLERTSLPLDKDCVIISITNPKCREARLDHLGCKVYRFVFDDCEEFSDFYPCPITDEQAKDIVNILQNHNKVVVHCEMAYSRSPAVAIFARNKLGFNWVNETWDCLPNKLVYTKLTEVIS